MKAVLAIPLLAISIILMIIMLPFVIIATLAFAVNEIAQFIVKMLTDTVEVFNRYIQGE